MPGVNAVQPRVGGGLLDSVLKGVQVARDVYGIKHEGDMADIAQQREDREQQGFDERGAATAKDIPYILRYSKTVPEGTAGAVDIPVVGAPGKDPYILHTLPKKEQDYRPVQDYVDQKSGQRGTAFVDVNNPEGGAVGFVPTAKPDKTPTPHITPLGQDADGNMVTLDTTTGATNKVPMGGQLNKIGRPPPATDAMDPKALAKERQWLSDTFVKDGQRSVIGSLDAQIKGGEKIQTLLNAHPNGQLPPQLQSEVAMGLARLVMGGSAPSQAEVEKMDPQTRGTFMANLWSKISDQPYSADNPEFIKLFGDTIEREIGTARDQYAQKVAQARYSVPNLYKNDPDAFFGITGADRRDFKEGANNAFSYTPKMIGNKAGVQPQSNGSGTAIAAPTGGGGHPQDAAALAWANQNILSPDPKTAGMARQILQLNGAK